MIIRDHPTSCIPPIPLYREVEPRRQCQTVQEREVRELIDQAGGSNVRVFGSVATGTEHAGSDIDRLFDMGTPMGLIELGTLERRLCELLGADVDLIPAATLRPDLRDRVLAEAVAL